jgi:hypothetical protein
MPTQRNRTMPCHHKSISLRTRIPARTFCLFCSILIVFPSTHSTEVSRCLERVVRGGSFGDEELADEGDLLQDVALYSRDARGVEEGSDAGGTSERSCLEAAIWKKFVSFEGPGWPHSWNLLTKK